MQYSVAITPVRSRRELWLSMAVLLCWLGSLLSSPTTLAQINVPKARVVNMEALDAILLSDTCINAPDMSQPPGCKVNPSQALILKGITTDTVRLQHMKMAKGSKSPSHNHPDEEVFYLLEGKLKVTGGEDTFILMPKDIFVVPGYMVHQFEALQDSVFVEVGGPGPLLSWPALKKVGGQIGLED